MTELLAGGPKETRQNLDKTTAGGKVKVGLEDQGYESPNEDQIMTVKDMCRVARTDIKRKNILDKLLEVIYYSVGCVLGTDEYRKILQKAQDKDIPKKI